MSAEFILESDMLTQSVSNVGELYRSQTLENYLQRRLEEDSHDALIENEALNALFLRWLRVFSNSKHARKTPKSKLDLALGRFDIDIQVPTRNEEDDFLADSLSSKTPPAIRGQAVLKIIEKYITDEASRDQLYKIFTVADDLSLFGIDPFMHTTKLDSKVKHRYKIKIQPDGKILITVITKIFSLNHPSMLGPAFIFTGTQPIFTSIMTYSITPTKDQKAILSIVKHEELINLKELKQEVSKQTGEKKEAFSRILNDLQKYCGFEPKSIKTPSCKHYQSLETTKFTDFEYHNKKFDAASTNPIEEALSNLQRNNVTVVRGGVQVAQWQIGEKNLPENYHLDSIKNLACDPRIESALIECFAQQKLFIFSGINKIQAFFTEYNVPNAHKPYINDDSIKLNISIRKIGDEVFVTIHTAVHAFVYASGISTDSLINSDTPFYQSSITYRFAMDEAQKKANVNVIDFQELLEDMEPIIKMNKAINQKRLQASENIISKYIPVNNKELRSVEVNNRTTFYRENQDMMFPKQHTESVNNARSSKRELFTPVRSKDNGKNIVKTKLATASEANVKTIGYFEEIINNYAATLPQNETRDVGIAHHVIHVLKDSFNKKGKKLQQCLGVISQFEEEYISSHMNLILSSFSLIQLGRLHKKLRKVLEKGPQKNIYKKMLNAIEDVLIRNQVAYKKLVNKSGNTDVIIKCIKNIRKHISTSYKLFKFLGGSKIDFIGAIERLGTFAGSTVEVANRLHNIKTTELIEIYKRIARNHTQNVDLVRDIIEEILEERGISSKYIISSNPTHPEQQAVPAPTSSEEAILDQAEADQEEPAPTSPKLNHRQPNVSENTM